MHTDDYEANRLIKPFMKYLDKEKYDLLLK